MRSGRGASPKISSDSVTEPASLPSSVVTFISMSRTFLRSFSSRRCFRLGWRLGRSRGLELAGLRQILRRRLLHGVAHRDPAALGAGHRAFDHDEAALDVGLHDAQIQRGDAVGTHVSGHLLVLEGLAGILAAAGRPNRAMRDRHAVRGAQAAEVPALHAAREALADRGAGNVDILPDQKMVGRDLGADRDHRVIADAEFGDGALGLHLCHREAAALGLAHVLHLAGAGTELQRDITIFFLAAMCHDLALRKTQHGDGHMLSGLCEEAGHSHLLCDHTGAHVTTSLFLKAQSLISTSTPAARSSFISASTVCGVGSTMSKRRLWVRISNCSRLFLSTWGERFTVNFSILVGSGIGPRTWAPVRLAVLTISRVDASRMR